MKVLGISASPRRGGNSEALLDKVLEGAGACGLETEKIILNEQQFRPCQECAGCRQTGRCVIDDAMQAVYARLDAADIVILASPIFFGSLSAQLKAMIDRCQCYWTAKYVLGYHRGGSPVKKGYLILTSAADKKRFFQNAESIVKNLFAVLDIEFKDKLYCPNVDEPFDFAQGKILEHPDCLRHALQLGNSLGGG
ncbi:MAG: flavodoxin family protein [Candidatus Omnitrophota bacterium]